MAKVLTDEWKRLERACEQGSIAVVRECITVSHVSVHSQNQVDCCESAAMLFGSMMQQ
jgi:hypothetical protein